MSLHILLIFLGGDSQVILPPFLSLFHSVVCVGLRCVPCIHSISSCTIDCIPIIIVHVVALAISSAIARAIWVPCAMRCMILSFVLYGMSQFVLLLCFVFAPVTFNIIFSMLFNVFPIAILTCVSGCLGTDCSVLWQISSLLVGALFCSLCLLPGSAIFAMFGVEIFLGMCCVKVLM